MNMSQIHINTKETVARPLARVAEPRQNRSRIVMKKIVKSTLSLLNEKRFEDISVSEIARRAGVAVGTVYTRFPSKDQLLLHLFDTVVIENVRSGVGVSPARSGEESLEGFLQSFFWSLRNAFVEHQAILRPLTLVARSSRDSDLGRFVRTLNATMHPKISAAIMRHRRCIKHPQPEVAVHLAILWAGAALREKCLYGEPVSTLANLTDKAFVKEIVRGVLAYLTCDPQAKGKRA